MVKIYTKQGDFGRTSFFGEDVDKDDIRIELLGKLDQLQSQLSYAYSLSDNGGYKKQLMQIVATIPSISLTIGTKQNHLSEEDLALLETWLDELTSSLPSLQKFILPIGSPCCSYLHIVRSYTREVERCYINYAKQFGINEIVSSYLNRLSDYLFQLARSV